MSAKFSTNAFEVVDTIGPISQEFTDYFSDGVDQNANRK